MSKHTPGPWEACNGCDVFTGLGALAADGRKTAHNDGWHIADCSPGGSSVEGDDGLHELSCAEVAANARLIAAAPELLKELTLLTVLLHPWIEAGNTVPGIATLNGAWAAIRKATGDDA